MLEGSGLRSLLPCLHLVRTVRLNGSQFDDNSVRKLTEVASEVRRTLGFCTFGIDSVTRI